MTNKHKKRSVKFTTTEFSLFFKAQRRAMWRKKASEILEEKQLMDEVWRSPYFTPSAGISTSILTTQCTIPTVKIAI